MFTANNSREPAKTKAERAPGRTKSKVETAERVQANPLWHHLATRVQAKLTVSAPGDPQEREADKVADRVMRMTAPAPIGVAPAPATAVRIADNDGVPLPGGVRSFFEPRLGQDFSAVRMHADSQAADAARRVAARAFTVGEHLVFGDGEYAPETATGRHLLAHELTHVVQQRSSTGQHQQAVVQREVAPPDPTERVGTSLWAKGPDGQDLPPSLEDISQGTLKDCYLFAAMAAVVHNNPQRIVNMIKDNGFGTYTVTFKGIGTFSSATQTVTADFAVGKHGNVRRNAFWPLIIEKAYAQQKGGIDKISSSAGGNAGSAVDELTNDGPSRFDPREKSVEYIVAKLVKAKEKKWPVTILSPNREDASAEKKVIADGGSGLRFWHFYAIVDVDAATNRIKLFNPWGHSHPNGDGWITIEQARKFFIEVSIND